MVKATPRLLYPRKKHPVPIVQEAGWAPVPVWTGADDNDDDDNYKNDKAIYLLVICSV